MKKRLSVIIPSYNRNDRLSEKLSSLRDRFSAVNFDDYEIIAINSGSDIDYIRTQTNTTIYNFKERKYPGIARNIGIEKSSGEWIWFIDDDDEINTEGIMAAIKSICSNSSVDIIAHSLKMKYEKSPKPEDVAKNLFLFKEKQEVFNYIFRRNILNNIRFSDGVHEDIRFSTELLLVAKTIVVLDQKIYEKITRDDSITKKLNFERIDGYINAINEILEINSRIIKDYKEQIVSQCLGTILHVINRSDPSDKIKLLKYLKQKFPSNLISLVDNKYGKNSTNFKYAVSLFIGSGDLDKLINELDYCFRTHLSCRDLKNSVFFGPHEIIGCCKRFFYNGKMKGDIILMPDSADITLERILNKKRQIEDDINRDSYEPCEGCPYIERFEQKKEEKINYISIENYTYCNMKCSYCSPKYYGGRESLYDTYGIISELINGKHLGNQVHVVWGGGEPTLSPKFYEITNDLIGNDNVSIVRVLSNSLRFSEGLNALISHNKIRLVTSIDAGTQEKFKEIRGRGEMKKVLENLKNYKKSMKFSENLTIKYIITEDNCESEQLDGFVETLKNFELEDNFIQISCNFKVETPNEGMTYAIYELAARLLNRGFKFVYFDDLIRDRLQLSEEFANKILNFLEEKNLSHPCIYSHKTNKSVILWGNGYQSQWIKEQTNFGKAGKIINIISEKNDLTNEIPDDVVICPCAVQSLPDIYKEIKNSPYLSRSEFVIFI